jgi:hypothetical protein
MIYVTKVTIVLMLYLFFREGELHRNKYFLVWFHHSLIVVAQIGEHTFVAERSLKHAKALPMTQQGFMKIVGGTEGQHLPSLQ